MLKKPICSSLAAQIRTREENNLLHVNTQEVFQLAPKKCKTEHTANSEKCLKLE